MYSKKMAGRMKRTLAGLLAAGLVLTGMPMPVVEAANEVLEEQRADEGESFSDSDEPTGEEGSSDAGQPDDAESVSDNSASGEEEGAGQGSKNPEDAAGTEAEMPQPGMEDAEEGTNEDANEEMDSGGAEEVTQEDVPAETPLYDVQVSGNDISGNDLEETAPDEVLITVEGGGSYQEGAFSVPDERAGSRPRRAAAATKQQSAADMIYEALKCRSTEMIDISSYNFSEEELYNLVIGIVNDHPELYYATTSFSVWKNSTTNAITGVALKYINDVSFDDAKFQKGVQDALASVKQGMTELEKAIALHDYIALNCEYDKENYDKEYAKDNLDENNQPKDKFIFPTSYSAYGVFAERIAVCQGYALAYKYLLNQVGIECYMVSSDAMNHAWNLIKLGNSYYQVDVTWDDPTWDRIGRVAHTYMFLSDGAFYDESEGHYGWKVTSGSGVVDLKAENTQYDSAFWVGCQSPLVMNGSDCYYITFDEEQPAGIIKKAAFTDINNKGNEIKKIGYWPDWNEAGKLWVDAYSGLFQIGDCLYYNDKTSIYSIKMDGSDSQPVFTADTTSGYIYGSAYCQGEVLYTLHQSPKVTEKEKVLKANITTGGGEAETYVIIYMLDGGQNDQANPVTYTADSETIILQNAVRDGYVFDGWYSDEIFSTKIEQITKGSTGNLTLYAKWTPQKVTIENAEVSFVDAGQSFTYDGTAHEPKVIVKVSGQVLEEGTDYTLSYENNKNAGDATVKVAGMGNYTGTASKPFVIQKAKLTMKAKDIVIKTGDSMPPAYGYEIVKGKLFGSDKLVQEPSYTCSAADSSKAGEYTITISGADAGNNYEITYENGILTIEEKPVVTFTVTFDVQGHGTAPAELKNIPEGAAITKPADPTAAGYDFGGWYKDAACTKAWNFDTDKVNADLTLYAKWTLQEAPSLANAEISFVDAGQSFTYDGTAHEPKVTVKVSGKELTENTDYTLSYEDNKNAGTAKVVVTGKGGYSGTAGKTFSIQKAKLTMKAKDIVIKTGDSMPPAYGYEIVKGKLFGSDKLVQEPSYTCSVTDSSTEGEYTITISGANAGNNYEISYVNGILKIVEDAVFYTVTFDVQGHGTAPAELENILEGAAITKPEKDPAAAGYDFGGWYKDAACKEPWDFEKDTVTENLTLYAKWTRQGALSLAKAEISFVDAGQSFTYDGTEHKPRVTVKISGKELTENTDYTLSYEDNKNAGTATVRVTGMGGYSSSASKTFSIQRAKLTIKAKDIIIKTGDPIPSAFEYEFVGGGLIGDDALMREPSYTCNAVDSSIAGEYSILISGADAGNNYAISYESGTLKIVENAVFYTVTFDVQGHGTAPAKLENILEGSTITKPEEDLAAAGYDFGGWYKDAACTEAWDFATDKVNADLTLYAKWTAREAFSLEDAELFFENAMQRFTYDGTEQRPRVTVMVSGKELVEGTDYTLSYVNNKNAGTATVLVTGIGACVGAVSRIFEIQKAPLTVRAYNYSIRVNDPVPGAGDYAYGVDGLMPGDSLLTAPLLTCAVTDTASAGDYDIIPSGADAGENYTISYVNGRLQVVSEYSTFKVTFDVQGHGIAPTSYVVRGGSTVDAPPEPSVGGYRFDGWYRDKACTQAWKFETDIVQENLTLYAKWLGVVSSAEGESFAVQEISDIYYTGKPCKPAVTVYDGGTLLRAGRDYQIKYYNNTNANIGGTAKTGNGAGTDFVQELPYVEIIGKGNYTAVAKVNFNILRIPIGDGGEIPAAGVKLSVKDQLVTASGGYLNPFSSIKYVKAMRQNTDYTVSLRAVEAKDSSGAAVTGEMGGNVIPAGYTGKFLLTVTGQGNYDGSICRTIYVADRGHLMKNAVVRLGKNQKNVAFTGKAIELAASETGSDDAFTVKCGGSVLKPGQDYTVGYRGNDKAGKAELVITGAGKYIGSKTVTFRIKGMPFTTKTVNVSGIEDRVYSGKAWTLDDVVLTDTALHKRLGYGTDYTASYSNNVNKGTATVTFVGIGKAGYSGSFSKTFKIAAADIGQTTFAEDMQPLVFDYCKAGVKPTDEIVLIGANGARLKNGRDYTLRYTNNKDVAAADGANPPTVIVKGKGNYTGERRIPFQIVKADLAELALKTTPTAYRDNKPSSYIYKPKIRLMDGKTALREGKDYLITYRNNTQEDCGKYIQQENAVRTDALSQAAGVPVVVITENPESSYRLEEPIVIPLPVYREQFRKAEMDVAVGSAFYTGSQVRPTVKVSYGDRLLVEGVDYTLSYGPNVKSGRNGGSVTVNGLAPAYGGSVTVKFGISRRDIAY